LLLGVHRLINVWTAEQDLPGAIIVGDSRRIARDLRDGARVNAHYGNLAWTPLMFAVVTVRIETVEALLSRGADPRVGSGADTPLATLDRLEIEGINGAYRAPYERYATIPRIRRLLWNAGARQ
jgi:hypothetical protein